MRRSTGVLVFVLACFLLFKILRFVTLTYTFHDMYGFLQIATSWLDGRPFMYENYFGYHQRIHNYYTVWLWGPLCYYLGAYGLFLIQTLLLLFAYGLANERIAKRGTPNWARYGLLSVVLLSPVSIWLNDHTNMGWHSELTYLPLGVLFAVTLTQRGWVGPVIAGLGVTLVKEDGAVLAALIHLGHFCLTYLRAQPDRRLWNVLAKPRFWLIGLGWGVVFIAGMVWLGYLNNFAEPRLRVALSVIARNSTTEAFWLRNGQEIGKILLLLLTPIGLIAVLCRQVRLANAGRLFVLYGAGILILLALNFVQASFYYEDPYPPAYHWLGLTWPPRFVLLWSFTAAFVISTLVVLSPHLRPLPTSTAWLVVGGLVLVQVPLLRVSRSDLPGRVELQATLLGRINPFKERRFVDPADLAKLQCLAEHLPDRSNVIAFEQVLPYFHKHYLIWPTDHAYRPADLAIVPLVPPNNKPEWPRGVPVRRPYRQLRLKNYYLYVTADYESTVQQCLR